MKIVFYKIYLNSDEQHFYIGSTNNFSRRKSHHKKNVLNRRGKRYWTKLYLFIRENGGWSNFTMAVMDTIEYESRTDAFTHEMNLIKEHKPPLNTIC